MDRAEVASLQHRVEELTQQAHQLKSERDKAILADRCALLKRHHLTLGDAGRHRNDTNGPVSSEIIDILKITPLENEALKKAFLEARSKEDELKSRYLTVTTNTPDTLVFQIPPFPEGREVQQRLDRQMESALGKDRSDSLKLLKAAGEGEDAFDNSSYAVGMFGQSTITVQINYQTNSREKVSMAQMHEWISGTNGKEEITGSYSGDIPPRYRNIISVAPQK